MHRSLLVSDWQHKDDPPPQLDSTQKPQPTLNTILFRFYKAILDQPLVVLLGQHRTHLQL